MNAISIFYRRGLLFLMSFGLCLLILTGVNVRANLPTDAPVLISESSSTRAVVVVKTKSGFAPAERIIEPTDSTRITVFVTNLDLLENEGANAFRADVQTAAFYRYPLRVVSLAPSDDYKNVYALTLQLRGDIGSVGDVLLRVTWRGMSSNRVRLSFGYEGGKVTDDEGAMPTPFDGVYNFQEQLRGELPWTGDRVRFMNQATFGVNPAVESRLRRVGYSVWLTEQMEQKYNPNGGFRYSSFPYPNVVPMQTDPMVGCPTANVRVSCLRENYSMYPLQKWFYREAIYGEDQQLRRRVSWALHQIWVTSGRDIEQSGRMLPYIKTLDKHAFGNYRDILLDMTLNPTMGHYLDMAISTKNSPNENYAREILQLFSIGLERLNMDGTPIRDANGEVIPTYDQQDIINYTKVFTGWTFCNGAGCPNAQPGLVNYLDPMRVNPANHDMTEKRLLRGTILPAGQSPDEDLQQTIDNIFTHPNLAPFVSKLLIGQLVTSNPTPAYVRRVARAFEGYNGEESTPSFVKGDMKRTIRAILLDPEARGNFKTDPDYGKLREPVTLLTGMLRPLAPTAQANANAAGCTDGLSDGILNGLSATLDQDVFNPPSVFNYYQLDYRLVSGLAGPEFSIMTTGTALKRPNQINQMIFGTGVTVVNAANPNSTANGGNYIPCGTRISLDRWTALSQADSSGALLVDTVNREFLNSSLTPQVRGHILTAVQAVSGSDHLKRARTALYLALTSSQFQVQR